MLVVKDRRQQAHRKNEALQPKVARQELGYALAALAAFFWSTLGVLAKMAYSIGAEPLTIISLRATIATVIIGAIMILTNPTQFLIRRSDLPFFVGYGLFGVSLNYIGYFYALRLATVATAITLLYTYPALVVVVAFIVYREPITRSKVLALLLTFLGIVATALGSSSTGLPVDPRGLIFGLLGGVGTAVYTLAGKRAQITYSAQTSLFYSFLFGALGLGAFRFVEFGPRIDASPEILSIIFVIAITPTLGGYGFYTYSLRFIEAGRAGITSSIEPAIATYLAFLFLGEMPSSIQLIGTALIVTGVVALHFEKRNRS